MARNQFASKLGLIAATVGSAVGLGNIWRFPAETADNGGAAFLLLYIVCIAVLGIPVMLAEFALGRAGRSDSVGVFRKIAPGTKWWVVGIVSVVAPFMINGFRSAPCFFQARSCISIFRRMFSLLFCF